MIEAVLLNQEHLQEWDTLVNDHPQGSIFHTSRWLKLCAAHQKARLHCLGFFSNRALVGIFPFYEKRFGPFRTAASPFVVENTPYMGPLAVGSDRLAEIVPEIERWLGSMRINFSRIILQERDDGRGFSEHGYKEIVRHTHVLDLSVGQDNIWKRMEGRARTAIRKSEKSGVVCAFENDVDVIDEYYKMATAIYRRQAKITPHPKEFYRDICFGPVSASAKLATARLDGALIAAAIFVFYKGWLYYLDAVSDKDHNALCAPSGIQWFIIKWAMDAGLRQYDFVGSDMPWLSRFKASFGGTLHEYPALEKARPEWVALLRRFYGSRVRPFLQKLRTSI